MTLTRWAGAGAVLAIVAVFVAPAAYRTTFVPAALVTSCCLGLAALLRSRTLPAAAGYAAVVAACFAIVVPVLPVEIARHAAVAGVAVLALRRAVGTSSEGVIGACAWLFATVVKLAMYIAAWRYIDDTSVALLGELAIRTVWTLEALGIVLVLHAAGRGRLALVAGVASTIAFAVLIGVFSEPNHREAYWVLAGVDALVLATCAYAWFTERDSSVPRAYAR